MKRTNSFLLPTTLVCCAILFSAWANAPIKTTVAPPPPTLADIYEDAQPGSFLSIAGAPQAWLTNAVKGWMGKLPVSTQLSRISIPGTHDSQTAGYAVGVATQSWSIAEQLDAGIRYLDLRLKTKPNSRKIDIYHGDFYVGSLDDVLNAVKSFLTNNPTEAVLIEVQHGGGNDGDLMRDYLKDYLTGATYGSLFLPSTNSACTIGTAKGKIVLLRNIGCRSGEVTKYGIDIDNFYTQRQNYYQVYAFAHEETKNSDWATFPSKIKLAKEFVDKAVASTSGCVVNYLSGSTGMTPYDVAVGTNSAVYEKIGSSGKKRYLGLIVMDWPGDRMIYRIIKSNFDFEADCNCPAKTFRGVDSHRTWVEFRMPQGKGGEVRSFPAGAYHRYVFPACHRTWWTDTKFRCNPTTKVWEKVGGDFGANGECTSYIPAGYPEIVTGDK
ncbi:MAG: phosphatidylinositol-specific phospholipase C domain-containing protein [Saprospiraceae bacterium]|jgi:1-phosphatidylinositol phosphodiesterase|nr:phosphatidylinositol-specific phospholipase C domain-containing protein [Saprospiraceae bacterium]